MLHTNAVDDVDMKLGCAIIPSSVYMKIFPAGQPYGLLHTCVILHTNAFDTLDMKIGCTIITVGSFSPQVKT